MEYVDEITLNAGHSIMMAHKPDNVDITKPGFMEAKSFTAESIEKFGLFGDSSQYNTYYPDVSEQDFNPTDKEIINPVYRLLSEVIVQKGGALIDFGAIPGVLKNAMPLLVGQTVNCDHETNIANAIGSVKDVVWQDAYTDDSGVKIPAGINGVFAIDGKSNPRIARGITMTPPSIHSNSVTVRFKWEKSHPNIPDDKYWDLMGQIVDNRLVKRDVTKIDDFIETSLVSNGADPFAKQVRDGKVVNVNIAASKYSFNSDTAKDAKAVSFSYKKQYTSEISNSNKNNEEMTQQELETRLQELFGENLLVLKDGEQVSMGLVISKVKEAIELSVAKDTEINKLKEEKTTLASDKSVVETELSTLKASYADSIKFKEEAVKALRESSIADYTKLSGEGNLDEAVVTMLNTVDYTTLQTMHKMYTQQLEEKFPLKCGSCGSKDVSRASSFSNDDEPDTATQLSNKDAINAIRKAKLNS